jgi:hypothetical protein
MAAQSANLVNPFLRMKELIHPVHPERRAGIHVVAGTIVDEKILTIRGKAKNIVVAAAAIASVGTRLD